MLFKVIDTNNYSKPSMPEIKFLTSDELRTLTDPSDPKSNDSGQSIYLNLDSRVTNKIGRSLEEAVAAYPVSGSSKERLRRNQNRLFIKWAIFTKYPYYVDSLEEIPEIGGGGSVEKKAKLTE